MLSLEPRRDPSELLELAEAALDQVALTVEMLVDPVSARPRRVIEDRCDCVPGSNLTAQRICIVGDVGHDDLGRQAFDQGPACG